MKHGTFSSYCTNLPHSFEFEQKLFQVYLAGNLLDGHLYRMLVIEYLCVLYIHLHLSKPPVPNLYHKLTVSCTNPEKGT